MTKDIFPTMLAFTRSIEPNEALMYGVNAAGKQVPVEVVVTGQRGQSYFAKANNEKKGPKATAGKSNPQMVEIARLPVGCTTLQIVGALRVMPNSQKPSATDSAEAFVAFRELSQKYAELGGYKYLAARYLENLANGRMAWRNRSIANEATTIVSINDVTVTFDNDALKSGEILGVEAMKAAVVVGKASDVDLLIEMIADGMTTRAIVVEYTWTGTGVTDGAEVFPSQEYIRSEEKSDIARNLSGVKIRTDAGEYRQATMHAQKIGAAVRAIDDWHGNIFYGALPVNAFAGHQESGFAVRHGNPDAPSYYDIAKKPEKFFLDDMNNGVLNDNAHFFMANIVRGGVYSKEK